MQFISHERNCHVNINFFFTHGKPSVVGKVHPFDGNLSFHIHFSVAQNLEIRAESGRVVMCPMLRIEMGEDRLGIFDYEADQFMVAMEVARERMNRYHSLYNQFTNFDNFLEALETALRLGRHDDAAQYLCLCPFITEEAIDEALTVIFSVDPALIAPTKNTPWHEALSDFVTPHPDHKDTLEAFIEKKTNQLFF